MKSSGLGASAAGLILLTLTLAGCGGGGGSSGSGSSSNGPMYIQTCSLGCSSGQNGAQVSCALVSTHVNQDIAVYFSQAIDPASLNSSSINVVDVNTGAVPPGLRLIDPLNPAKVIFRPTITFDTQGNATFGFVDNHTYRIVLPGQQQGDPGPFVRSMGGKSNQSRMQCEIQTSLGVVDLVPGAPVVDVRVDQAIPATPNPNDTVPNVEAQGATDVWHNSTIRFAFNDIMNPATLAPNGQATFITIEVDLDGDLQTFGDRQPLAGSYVVTQNTVLLTTSMVFTATNGIPSSGNPALNPALRKVVVTLPPDVRDLAGNQLHNPEVVAFTPEFVALAPVVLPDADGENFTDQNNLDAAKSSAEWHTGRLTRGYGGGSGRCGELIIPMGQTVTLNTDSQSFPLASQSGHNILDNLQPGIDYFPGHPENGPEFAPPLVVTDGIFEFSTIQILPGGRLILTGVNPARVFSRGSINLQGTLDISGQSSAVHASDLADGGAGGVGGPNAGDGGKGATRADNTNQLLINIGAINIDETMITVDPNGAPGGGVGKLGTLAAGLGGLHNPDSFPFGPNFGQLGTISLTTTTGCVVGQVGSPGGGGAYATDGSAAIPGTVAPAGLGDNYQPYPVANDFSSNLPPVIAAGGNSSVLNIEPPGAPPVIRKLDSEGGHLRGGSGGGGGGSDVYDSSGFGSCSVTDPNFHLLTFQDNSGAGGGGGGGAMQLVSGHNVTVSGLIDGGGGDGGSAPDGGVPPVAGNDLRTNHAPPGGAGSGGAVRLQGQLIDLVGTTQLRVDVSGGVGGGNFNQSQGGAGGAGLIRLEASLETLDMATEAPHLGPTTPSVVGPNSENILSVGNWALPRRRPECFTGAASCWMKPTANAFQILFAPDDPMNADPALRYGWNMDVIYDSGAGEQLIKFRGPDANLPFTPTMATPDFEHFLGNTLNYGVPAGTGSYLAVRFQGIQVIPPLQQPCNLSLNPSDGQVLPNSLTPWVRHSADLNQFNPKPNAVRFSVVFDTSLALAPNSIPSFIKGVTNLKILAQPD